MGHVNVTSMGGMLCASYIGPTIANSVGDVLQPIYLWAFYVDPTIQYDIIQ